MQRLANRLMVSYTRIGYCERLISRLWSNEVDWARGYRQLARIWHAARFNLVRHDDRDPDPKEAADPSRMDRDRGVTVTTCDIICDDMLSRRSFAPCGRPSQFKKTN
jgi:hypothetical protein